MATGRLAWMARQIGASTSIRGQLKAWRLAWQRLISRRSHHLQTQSGVTKHVRRVLESENAALPMVDLVATIEFNVLRCDFPVQEPDRVAPAGATPKRSIRSGRPISPKK
jgi:hypothetical protein